MLPLLPSLPSQVPSLTDIMLLLQHSYQLEPAPNAHSVVVPSSKE